MTWKKARRPSVRSTTLIVDHLRQKHAASPPTAGSPRRCTTAGQWVRTYVTICSAAGAARQSL